MSDDRRTVVVSGGATRIGRAIVLDRVRAGERVVVVGTPEDAIRRTARDAQADEPGATVLCQPCDTGRPEQVQALARWLEDRHERVDVLINCTDVEIAPLAGERLYPTSRHGPTRYWVARWSERTSCVGCSARC